MLWFSSVSEMLHIALLHSFRKLFQMLLSAYAIYGCSFLIQVLVTIGGWAYKHALRTLPPCYACQPQNYYHFTALFARRTLSTFVLLLFRVTCKALLYWSSSPHLTIDLIYFQHFLPAHLMQFLISCLRPFDPASIVLYYFTRNVVTYLCAWFSSLHNFTNQLLTIQSKFSDFFKLLLECH